MQAMVFHEPGGRLVPESRPDPAPTERQVLVKIDACGVCRTDLHVQDNELPGLRYPIIPGHQAVGTVVEAGGRSSVSEGSRVGIAWLGWTCGECEYCRTQRENLCDRGRFHGYQIDGGFADHMLVDSRFCFELEQSQPAGEIAPLLCAGLIGFRSLSMAGDARHIGIYGFGSAAHIVTQVAVRQHREIYAFTHHGDTATQDFARQLGAVWAGGSDASPPRQLDAALIFAPDGRLVPKALKDLKKGSPVVCGGIHMSDIPSFPYADLWGERRIQSVANLTRRDGKEFMSLAGAMRIRPQITTYALDAANQALDDLRHGRINGTAVLTI
ncbi:MAG: zinc-dependent alcohol dehydrogenase family protein [Gammaproteobacteria bacterium]|nr:zinc-dependent alcohol dehydrogenase family protein [Gammaproteobacteria bacterium]